MSLILGQDTIQFVFYSTTSSYMTGLIMVMTVFGSNITYTLYKT